MEAKSILCQGEERHVLSGGGGARSDNASAGGDRGGCGGRQQMGIRHMGKEDRKKPGGARPEGDAEGRVGEPLWIPKEGTFLLGISLKSSPPPIADTLFEWHSSG